MGKEHRNPHPSCIVHISVYFIGSNVHILVQLLRMSHGSGYISDLQGQTGWLRGQDSTSHVFEIYPYIYRYLYGHEKDETQLH